MINKNIKIGTKISGLVIGLVIMTVATISFIAYNFSRDALEDKYLQNLEIIAQNKAAKIDNYFKNVQQVQQILQNTYAVKASLSSTSGVSIALFDSALAAVNTDLPTVVAPLVGGNDITNLIITDASGHIIYTSNPEMSIGQIYPGYESTNIEEASSTSYFDKVDAENQMLFAAPAQDLNGNQAGYFFMKINIQPVLTMVKDTFGLGNTGEIQLGQAHENKVIYLNKMRHDEKKRLRTVYFDENIDLPLQMAVKGNSGAGLSVDYREKEIISAWAPLETLNWGVVAKIDRDETFAEGGNLLIRFIIAGLIVLTFSAVIAIIFSRVLINPLLSLKSTLQLVGKGVLPKNVHKRTNDEIGEMAETVNSLVKGLQRTADFAHNIGEGDFAANFEPLSDKDTLGTSLINMRDSIKESEKKDKERNWIVTGLAEIGEILRSHDSLNDLGDDITTFITQKIDGIQGAFYVLNDDDPDNFFLEMKASYAYGKKKHLKGSFKFAQGLVGQAAIEQDTLLRTEIPEEYVTITSGLLGEQKPRSILIVPLITDEKVYGALEFAGFKKFTESQVKFVQELSLIIARTIFNIKVNERTRNLLAESQAMSNELQEQQEILRQNAEEMEATQEELKRTNTRLEEQIEEVNRTQKRMQLLLENASEVITIYEEDGSIRYISPSVEKIIGYSQDEMIGQQDIKYVQEEFADTYKQMFKDLLEKPFESVTVQYVYINKNGETVWLEATGNNLLSDPAIQGIIVNSRDITERRRAEQEERMRTKMQSLSENSPDLISRFDMSNNFFYINPVIENYTGFKPNYFVNKELGSVSLKGGIAEQWMQILEYVKENKNKHNTEIEFSSANMGDRVMQVNAIPEFDDKEALESILMVSHDITDRKLIELEIQSKNKKITESINYAKRIQGAILPDNHLIHQYFPKSFILYKARDVVSGDFPWFLNVGDDLFIAAVDCTGHGVPGALISLIGYFLLNDIVKSRKITNPGQILDDLDRGVTETLRQDQDDSKTKDGMDISLCRINLKKNEVAYAGAHRPLYIIKDDEFDEIKGNRFPIGGGIYKNQTKFDTYTTKVAEGDTIYFCSDGFPDQFGGPENRKFGPKRLRQFIKDNYKKPMDEFYNKIDHEWETWKGETKQTDDVLLIGIKF